MLTVTAAVMELEVWGGDWGVPSVDHNCLVVMAYCRFASVPVNIKKTNRPWKSPTGDLPVLRSESGSEADVMQILEYLRKLGHNIDQTLTSKQSADTLAFTALLTEKLLPAILYQWWMDGKTYVELTRPWYAKAVGFPLSLYWPPRKQSSCRARLMAQFGTSCINESEIETLVLKNAKECLNLLSARLADRNYFFGDKPTSLDAVVYGHLQPLLKAPLSSSALHTHLKACRNLVAYCQQISNDYFPLSPEEQQQLRQRAEAERQQAAEHLEFPNRRRTLLVAGVTVATVMMTYALLTGLWKVEVVDDVVDHVVKVVKGRPDRDGRRKLESDNS